MDVLTHIDTNIEASTFGDVAVVIPCYNEEVTVEAVVSDAFKHLPGAEVHVYDNNSTDRTVQLAQQSGATVHHELRQGKGFVLRRAFADLDKHIIVIVDGDATYDLSFAPTAIRYFRKYGLDYLNIRRDHKVAAAYRPGHVLGNKVLTGAVRWVFGPKISDMLSGYKLLSSALVKSFPSTSSGFEIETELTVHALELKAAVAELSAPYAERPAGSTSKLSTFRDGFKILLMIARLLKSERPFAFFMLLATVVALASAGIGVPVIIDFFQTGIVRRFPTAFLAGFLAVISVVLMSVGLTLDLVQISRAEQKQLAFIRFRGEN